MVSKNKLDRDKEKEKAETQLSLELQEKRMLDGMKEICNNIKEELKEFWRREMGELRQEVRNSSPKIEKVEQKNKETDMEIKQVKSQNRELEQAVATLEYKILESHIRLRGVPEGEGENIHEFIVEKLAQYLEESPEDISFNFESIYRVNSTYAKRKQLPRVVVQNEIQGISN